MVYPCGWWERVDDGGTCRCAFLDMLGYLLFDDAPIFTQDKFLMENITELRIDYIHGDELVKFVSKMHVDDGNGTANFADKNFAHKIFEGLTCQIKRLKTQNEI